jgi:hypothetical protein
MKSIAYLLDNFKGILELENHTAVNGLGVHECCLFCRFVYQCLLHIKNYYIIDLNNLLSLD